MFSIKNKNNLPMKLNLQDKESSSWWLQKRSKQNAMRVYDFLFERYLDSVSRNQEPKSYSLTRIAEATKLNPHQITYVVLLLTMMQDQKFKIKTDITSGGKPRHNVYLVGFFAKDKAKVEDLLLKNKASKV